MGKDAARQLQLGDPQLIGFSERLLHEIQIFFRGGRALVRLHAGLGRPVRWEVEMALVESFAVHTRALADFFFQAKRGSRFPNDAFAIDYFDSPKNWIKLAGPPGHWLRAIRDQRSQVDRFGAQIGHLNYGTHPLSEDATGWPTVQLMREMGSTLQTFIDNVPPQRVSDDFTMKARAEVPLAARLQGQPLALALWTPPATTRGLNA